MQRVKIWDGNIQGSWVNFLPQTHWTWNNSFWKKLGNSLGDSYTSNGWEKVPTSKWVGQAVTYSWHKLQPWLSAIQLKGNSPTPSFPLGVKGLDPTSRTLTFKTSTWGMGSQHTQFWMPIELASLKPTRLYQTKKQFVTGFWQIQMAIP